MSYRDDERREEEYEEQDYQRRMTGPVPSFCWTEDEYMEWRRGLITEGDLRTKHERMKKQAGG